MSTSLPPRCFAVRFHPEHPVCKDRCVCGVSGTRQCLESYQSSLTRERERDS